jgi:hypothetical protein
MCKYTNIRREEYLMKQFTKFTTLIAALTVTLFVAGCNDDKDKDMMPSYMREFADIELPSSFDTIASRYVTDFGKKNTAELKKLDVAMRNNPYFENSRDDDDLSFFKPKNSNVYSGTVELYYQKQTLFSDLNKQGSWATFAEIDSILPHIDRHSINTILVEHVWKPSSKASKWLQNYHDDLISKGTFYDDDCNIVKNTSLKTWKCINNRGVYKYKFEGSDGVKGGMFKLVKSRNNLS